MESPAGARLSNGRQNATAPHDGATPGRQPLWQVGTRALRAQLKNLRKCLATVREGGDTEDIHQMRVATRRLRTVARILETTPVFRARRVKRLRKQLQPLASSLGAVRDLDILLERLSAYERETGQTSAALRDALRQRREKALKQLRKQLASPAIERLVRHPRRTVKRLIARKRRARRVLVRYVAGDALWKRYEAILSFEETIAGGASTQQLHALRIACKQMRYALELFSVESDPCAQSLIETLKNVQGHLGDLQDSVFAVALLSRLRHKYPRDRVLDGFRAAQEAQRDTHYQGFSPLWECISGPTYRQHLAALIAAL